jgi:hypothetical protein
VHETVADTRNVKTYEEEKQKNKEEESEVQMMVVDAGPEETYPSSSTYPVDSSTEHESNDDNYVDALPQL